MGDQRGPGEQPPLAETRRGLAVERAMTQASAGEATVSQKRAWLSVR